MPGNQTCTNKIEQIRLEYTEFKQEVQQELQNSLTSMRQAFQTSQDSQYTKLSQEIQKSQDAMRKEFQTSQDTMRAEFQQFQHSLQTWLHSVFVNPGVSSISHSSSDSSNVSSALAVSHTVSVKPEPSDESLKSVAPEHVSGSVMDKPVVTAPQPIVKPEQSVVCQNCNRLIDFFDE